MSITTYTELQTALTNWSDRTDLSARMPEFIALAEAKLNRTLRVRRMLSATTDTMSSSAITLPSDWAAFESIWYTSSGKRYLLTNIPIEEVNIEDAGTTGMPDSYYIAGSTVTFFPTADSNYTVGYVYYQNLPALSSNSTNWLLTSHPDIYLYASMLELSIYVKDQEDIQKYVELTRGAVLQLEKSDKDMKSGSALRMKAY